MGKILPSYKKAIIDDVIQSISSNSSHYYAYASNPAPYANGVPNTVSTNYSAVFENNWNLLFGKKLGNTDVVPVIRNITWANGTAYSRYDNTKDISNTNYYVVVAPTTPGGFYHVYTCINNSNGANSTAKPDLQQTSSFTKSDGYMWRYLYSISDADYVKFATSEYIPVTPNGSIQSTAGSHNGVEIVVVANGGVGYAAHHMGNIRSVANSTVLQIESGAAQDNGFYNNNAIYIYNDIPSTSQLKVVKEYVSNLSGNWVILETAANTAAINAPITQYRISPRIVFDTDGTTPVAYSIINATSNSISSIVVLDAGVGITRASARIVSNTVYGSGANLYCIVPPPGGHGKDPVSELNAQGVAFHFAFNGSEGNTLPINVSYNKIGLYKNPAIRLANGAKGSVYTNTSFKQMLIANVSPSVTFSANDTVTGQISGAKGVIAFSNSTQVFITGDKHFSNNETIVSSDGSQSTTININTLGNLYVDDLYPLYTKNIDTVTRATNQTETFKIIIQV